MNKYDFGYELLPGSTNDWAFHQVEANTHVLEIGSSNGNLIFHLTREKCCIADIVEINEEAGQEAARFARVACIGDVEGDLEKGYWFSKLSGNSYDYIIILDVLEHIRNPEEILKNLEQLLSENGTILLSVPNIAHNSLLLNLLQNKFMYTSVGLLDNTHIHFYTYDTLKQMLHGVGLVTETEEVIQKEVGENEIPTNYGNLPSAVESYLKTRPLGTAYQYLFKVKRGTEQSHVILQYKEDKHYAVIVFQNSRVIYENAINPRDKIVAEITLNEPSKSLRLDPLDKNCIVTNWEIQGFDKDNKIVKTASVQFTGNMLGKKMVFYDDDPQIYVAWEEPVSSISFQYDLEIFDNDALRALVNQKDYIRELEAECQATEQLRSELDAERQASGQLRSELEAEHRVSAQWKESYESLRDELMNHKGKSAWKVINGKMF